MISDYERIEEAIHYLQQNFKQQPDLDAIAAHVHMSAFHFQRMFTQWAGVSPKKFLQFLSIEYAKSILQKNSSIADVSFETGLSSPSRLHDLFINLEGMTPGEYKNGGEALTISYSYESTPFGSIFIASTSKGICKLVFINEKIDELQELKTLFYNAIIKEQSTELHENIVKVFQSNWQQAVPVNLHVKATPFQLQVWQALLKIPLGNVTTYGSIAEAIHNPNASRAVGTAIGSNPVAFLIPCHRVIQSTGVFGQYHWGATRKASIIGWEAAKIAQ